MTEPVPDYVTSPFVPAVHQSRRTNSFDGLSQDAQNVLRDKLVEGFLQIVTQAFTGSFIPGEVGAAFQQLTAWANRLGGDIAKFFNAFDGIDLNGGPGAIIRAILDRVGDALGFDQIRDWLEDLVLRDDVPENGYPYAYPASYAQQAISAVQQWFVNIRKFLGQDFSLPNFNLLDSAKQFIDDVLKPAKLLAELVDGKLPDIQAPKIVTDLIAAITGGVTNGITQIEAFFDRLRKFLGGNFLGELWNLDDAMIAFITNNLKPQNLLATLVNGKIPDIQAPQVLIDIVSAMQNALSGITNPLAGLANTVFGVIQSLLNGITGNASAVAVISTTQNAGTGKVYTTQFDGAAGTDPFPVIQYSGGGSGNWYVTGDGYTRWSGFGNTPRRCLGLAGIAATTKTQVASLVLATSIEGGPGPTPKFHLFNRSTSTMADMMLATVSFSSAEIGYVLGGVYTRLGVAEDSPGTAGGQQWDFFAGTIADDYQYVLKCNGQTVMTRTDAGHMIPLTNFWHGAGVTTGVSFFGGSEPPRLTAYGGGDKAA